MMRALSRHTCTTLRLWAMKLTAFLVSRVKGIVSRSSAVSGLCSSANSQTLAVFSLSSSSAIHSSSGQSFFTVSFIVVPSYRLK